MFYVYILHSLKDKNLYVGFTKNLQQRLKKYNDGKVFSTKSRRPLRCIYVEICLHEQDARQRERYLKTGVGKRYIKQRLKSYFNNITENI